MAWDGYITCLLLDLSHNSTYSNSTWTTCMYSCIFPLLCMLFLTAIVYRLFPLAWMTFFLDSNPGLACSGFDPDHFYVCFFVVNLLFFLISYFSFACIFCVCQVSRIYNTLPKHMYLVPTVTLIYSTHTTEEGLETCIFAELWTEFPMGEKINPLPHFLELVLNHEEY